VNPGTADPLEMAQVGTWIEAAQDGDAGAFNHLVDRYAPVIYPLAYRRCQNAEDAQECCQEAWLSAWRSIESFRGGPSALNAWLACILINACRDRVRYEMRRPSVPLQVDQDGATNKIPLPSPGQSPQDYAEAQDLSLLLEACLARLSSEHRDVLILDKVGFEYAEIGEILELEIGTVKSRLSRARARMRDMLRGNAPIGMKSSMEPSAASRRSSFSEAKDSKSESKPNVDPAPGSSNVKSS
jgi:RNA polymerase sigma-70 factor (ECF subfamily)